jgi:methionine-S-sulfoxide reductase
VRTRAGYAGGTTPDPTYRSIGDHTETLQIDYDPARVSYGDLLSIFWASHRPTSPAHSRQYASRVFCHDDAQRTTAEASRQTIEQRLGRVFTEVEPLERFYLAEDYHQKYRLRADRVLREEFAAFYPDEADLRESTAAARVNGYLDGWGTRAELEDEIDALGLSERARERLRAAVPVRLGRGVGVLSR